MSGAPSAVNSDSTAHSHGLRSALSSVARTLPEFSPRQVDAPGWIGGADVQSYLDYYQINFSRTMDGVKHRFGKMRAAGFSIALHYWLPPEPVRGTVFIVHGYYDHSGIYRHIIRFLLHNRFAVVIGDNPGHGLSSGERATIGSFDDYASVLTACLQRFEREAPEPWFGVGQSTGSAVILNALKNEGGLPFKKIVLLAPLVRAYGWRYLRWVYELVKHVCRRLPRSFAIKGSHDAAFVEFLRSADPLQPRYLPLPWVAAKKQWIRKFGDFPVARTAFLMIQGDADTTVDWRFNTALIREKFPNSELAIIPGARHQLVNESAEYRRQVFGKLLDYLLS